jgi:3',5'-cyclic AMP phosphodiesterase CpdA
MSPKPAFVVATGDISNVGNSNPPMYSVLTQFLFPTSLNNPGIGAYHLDSLQTIPMYFAPGNHDYYTTLYPPGSLTQTNILSNYAQYIAPDTDYAVIKDNLIILLMRSGNDIAYWDEIDPLTPDGSGLTASQCDWIRNQLIQNSNKRKIIVMHHPPENLAGTNCDGSAYTAETILDPAAGSLANNRSVFLNICDSNQVDVVLAGHQHQNVVTDNTGKMISENCTTCGTRYVQTGAAFNGCYRTISVTSSFVTVSPPMQSCTSTLVAEMHNATDVSVYPNPSKGIFQVSGLLPQISGSLSVAPALEIFNVLGEKVYSAIVNANQETVSLDVPVGIYFLYIKTTQGTAVQKLVIHK